MLEGLDTADKANALYLATILIVVLIGAASLRRLGFASLIKMALAWVAIFAVVLAASAYSVDIRSVVTRVAAEADPASGRVEGGEFHVRARSDGHFWVRAEIDDEPVLFLVDTGASGIVLTADAARRIGIDPTSLTYDRIARTANGTVRGASTRVATLEVGPIVRSNVAVDVTQGELDTNLLGMQFLRKLSGWRVEGDTLIMRP